MNSVDLSFPTPSKERAQVRLFEAMQLNGNRYPQRIVLNPADAAKLRRNMDSRHGAQRKPLRVLNVPVVEGECDSGMIRFEWG